VTGESRNNEQRAGGGRTGERVGTENVSLCLLSHTDAAHEQYLSEQYLSR